MKGGVFFKNLDALRFFAFLGVFNLHTILLSDTLQSSVVTNIIFSVLSFSYLGVPFFFTLSSFLITYRLLEEYKQTGKIKLPRFYAKRGLRIWPIYFLLLLICFLIIPALFSILNLEKPTLPNILPFIFFWANFYMIQHGVEFISALIVLWSLAIEEQFYIFWGLIMKYLRRYLVPVILVSLVISISFCYYYLYVLHQKEMNLKIHTLYAIPDFCSGALIAVICHTKNKSYNFLQSLPKWFYVAAYIVFISINMLRSFGVIYFDIIVLAVFNSLCYAVILFDQTFNARKLFNTGNFKTINYLGKISYGLYIYHLLIVSAVVKAFNYFKPGERFSIVLLQASITLFFTIIAAHVSYRYFERIFLKLKDKI